MGIKILVFFASTLIASVVSDDCFDYGTDYFGFDLGLDHPVSFRRTLIESCDSNLKFWLFTKGIASLKYFEWGYPTVFEIDS